MTDEAPNFQSCQANSRCPIWTMGKRCEFHPWGMGPRDATFVSEELRRNKLLVDYYAFLQTLSVLEMINPDVAVIPWRVQYRTLWQRMPPSDGSYVEQIRQVVFDAVMPGGFDCSKVQRDVVQKVQRDVVQSAAQQSWADNASGAG